MKTVDSATLALINSGDFIKADMWELTLSGGSVLRWSGADKLVSISGNQFTLGPGITRGKITDKMGFESSQLEVKLTFKDNFQISGVPALPFIRKRGLDGANLTLYVGVAPDWNSVTPMTGRVVRFAGRVTAVKDINAAGCTVVVTSWLMLLSTNVPPDVYQVPCLNTVFDAKCTLAIASFQYAGTIASVSADGTHFTINTGGSSYTTDAMAQGRFVITSTGERRTIRHSDSGVPMGIEIIYAFAQMPVVGAAVLYSLGCDNSESMCDTKFNNKINYRGQRFVPVPETAI